MRLSKRVVFVVILVCVGAALWGGVRRGQVPVKATYSEFLQQVQNGQVTKAVIVAGRPGSSPVTYSLKDGTRERTVLPKDYRDVLATLQQKMVNIEIEDEAWQWLRVLGNATPFLTLLAFWFFTMRRLPRRG